MVRWLLSDVRKTSLMSVKNATMHENRTTVQNNSAEFGLFQKLDRADFPCKVRF